MKWTDREKHRIRTLQVESICPNCGLLHIVRLTVSQGCSKWLIEANISAASRQFCSIQCDDQYQLLYGARS